MNTSNNQNGENSENSASNGAFKKKRKITPDSSLEKLQRSIPLKIQKLAETCTDPNQTLNIDDPRANTDNLSQPKNNEEHQERENHFAEKIADRVDKTIAMAIQTRAQVSILDTNNARKAGTLCRILQVFGELAKRKRVNETPEVFQDRIERSVVDASTSIIGTIDLFGDNQESSESRSNDQSLLEDIAKMIIGLDFEKEEERVERLLVVIKFSQEISDKLFKNTEWGFSEKDRETLKGLFSRLSDQNTEIRFFVDDKRKYQDLIKTPKENSTNEQHQAKKELIWKEQAIQSRSSNINTAIKILTVMLGFQNNEKTETYDEAIRQLVSDFHHQIESSTNEHRIKRALDALSRVQLSPHDKTPQTSEDIQALIAGLPEGDHIRPPNTDICHELQRLIETESEEERERIGILTLHYIRAYISENALVVAARHFVEVDHLPLLAKKLHEEKQLRLTEYTHSIQERSPNYRISTLAVLEKHLEDLKNEGKISPGSPEEHICFNLRIFFAKAETTYPDEKPEQICFLAGQIITALSRADEKDQQMITEISVLKTPLLEIIAKKLAPPKKKNPTAAIKRPITEKIQRRPSSRVIRTKNKIRPAPNTTERQAEATRRFTRTTTLAIANSNHLKLKLDDLKESLAKHPAIAAFLKKVLERLQEKEKKDPKNPELEALKDLAGKIIKLLNPKKPDPFALKCILETLQLTTDITTLAFITTMRNARHIRAFTDYMRNQTNTDWSTEDNTKMQRCANYLETGENNLALLREEEKKNEKLIHQRQEQYNLGIVSIMGLAFRMITTSQEEKSHDHYQEMMKRVMIKIEVQAQGMEGKIKSDQELIQEATELTLSGEGEHVEEIKRALKNKDNAKARIEAERKAALAQAALTENTDVLLFDRGAGGVQALAEMGGLFDALGDGLLSDEDSL